MGGSGLSLKGPSGGGPPSVLMYGPQVILSFLVIFYKQEILSLQYRLPLPSKITATNNYYFLTSCKILLKEPQISCKLSLNSVMVKYQLYCKLRMGMFEMIILSNTIKRSSSEKISTLLDLHVGKQSLTPAR